MLEIASNTQVILVIPKPSTGRHSHLRNLVIFAIECTQINSGILIRAIGYLQSVSENSLLMIPKRFLLAAQTHMQTSYRELFSTINKTSAQRSKIYLNIIKNRMEKGKTSTFLTNN